MLLSLLKSMWYLLTYIMLFYGFYRYKKSDIELNGISWLAIIFLAIMCFNTLIAGIISLISIPVNIITLSFANLAAGGALWFVIIKTKQRQQYFFEAFDFIATGILIVAVAFVAHAQFGTSINVNYETSDPSVHLRLAMDVFNTEKVSGMYFTALNNALFFELLSPLTAPFYYYKFFIVSDILMLFLSGLMFLAVIRRYLIKPFMKVIGIIVTGVYLYGYPLNNMIFGFEYLGVSVSIIAMLILFCDCFIHKELNLWFIAVLLGLGCLSLMVAYIMFVPVIYIGIFLCICTYLFKQKKLFKFTSLLLLVTIFLIPVALGMYYSYFGTFNSTTALTVGNAFNLDGYIYRDLYSNFIIFIPFALYGLVKLLKGKEPNMAAISFIAMVLFTGVLFVFGVYGKIAGYYYYKCYYVLWLLVFYLLVYGLFLLAERAKTLIIVYASVWTLLAGLNFSGLEAKLVEKKLDFVPSAKSGTYFDIYNFNKWKLQEATRYDPDMMACFKYIDDYLLDSNTARVQCICYFENVFWYEAITNQRLNNEYWWKKDQETLMQELKDGAYDYVIVQKYDGTLFVLDELQGYPIVFENDFGCVYLLSDQ